MFSFPRSLDKTRINPVYDIDKFIQTLWVGVLMNQCILNSSREATSESTGKSIIIPADEALTETELGSVFCSGAYLLKGSELTLVMSDFIGIIKY